MPLPCLFFFFFFNDTATTEIYTLSLHDALPISTERSRMRAFSSLQFHATLAAPPRRSSRSEEHTSELQSRLHLVCRLLLEKKKTKKKNGHKHDTTISDRTSALRLVPR